MRRHPAAVTLRRRLPTRAWAAAVAGTTALGLLQSPVEALPRTGAAALTSPWTAESSSSKAREAKRIEAELDALDERMSALAEDANEAGDRLANAKLAASASTARAADAEAALSAARNQATDDVRRKYVEGPAVGLSLHDDLKVNATRRVYRDLATGQGIDRIDEMDAAAAELRTARSRAASAEQRVKREQAAINAALRSAEALSKRQEALLAATQADVKRLLAAEEEQRMRAEAAAARAAAAKRKAAAEAEIKRRTAERDKARKDALARTRASDDADRARLRAATRAKPRSDTSGTATTDPGSGDSTSSVQQESDAQLAADAGAAPQVAASAGANRAVQTAMAQLGKAYVWGASGAQTFDCSGLMAFAWATGGKRLPHSSRAQYATTTRVAWANLQPGDLLFFGHPIHHVAMYIGNGQMVEAPHRRARVRVRSAYRKDYVGAGRVR